MKPKIFCNIDPNVLINEITSKCINIELANMAREGMFIGTNDLPDYVQGIRARVKYTLETSN